MTDISTTNPKDAIGRLKVPMGLLPAAGKIWGAMAMAFGAYRAGKDGQGYGPYNWREKGPISFTVYLDAIERHLESVRDGEDFAEDSLVKHLGHIIANCSLLLDAEEVGMLLDDRPKQGTAAALLKRLNMEAVARAGAAPASAPLPPPLSPLPPPTVDQLPPTGTIDELVVLKSNGCTYRWVGLRWVGLRWVQIDDDGEPQTLQVTQ